VSVLLLVMAALGGAAATYLFEDDALLPARLCMGAPLGMVGLGLAGYLLGWAFGVTMATALASATLVLVVPILVLRRSRRWAAIDADFAACRAGVGEALRTPRTTVPTVLFYAFTLVLVTWLFDRAMFESPDGGGVFTGVDHNLGDLPFHLSIATSFLYGHNFPPEHPELIGTRLTYPFVVDLVVAMLMAVGARASEAVHVQDLVLGWSLVGLLHRFARRVSRDRLAALIAPLLVLASGGLGFLMLRQDVDPLNDGLVGLLRHPTHDYTILPGGSLRWGNLAITMLIPQRSFLLGMPLFLIAATLWWQGVTEPDRERSRRLLLAGGAIVGLMPLAHAHAFTTALAVGVALAVLFPDGRGWSRALGLALLLALPQLLLIAWGASLQSTRFVGWQVGWDRGELGVAAFWWFNLGLFLPALAVALAWRGRRPVVERPLLLFYVPFACCFVVPNLVRLSPWIWDNVKFMVWWHVVSSVLIAMLLARLARTGWGGRVAAVALFGLLTLSGGLDLWRCASGKITLPIIPPEGTLFADDIRAVTPPRAVILHAPTYNSEVYLTGRRTVMGYMGHIWSQGLSGGTREDDVKKIYAGAPQSEALLAKYGVDFVMTGPREEALPGFDDRVFGAFPVVAQRGSYRLYRVPR
jgi:hypothetical protein